MKHPWFISIVVVVGVILAVVGRVSAQQVDYSLNLLFADPQDENSAGEWQLVAQADQMGLAAANVNLTDIATSEFHTPLGEVDGATVGFEINEAIDFGTYTQLVMAQVPQDLNVDQPLFYDVGVIGGGTMPGDTGPAFSFDPTTMRSIPWGMPDPLGDAAWNGAVLLASGMFSSGMAPAFFTSGDETSRGLVFTSVGDEVTPGTFAEAAVTTVVRDNLMDMGGLEGDYNNNGQVEQSDLDLVLLHWGDAFDTLPPQWVNQRPTMGIVDQTELDSVLLHWGDAAAAGLAGTPGVPEPSTLLLMAVPLGTMGAAVARNRRRARRLNIA